MGFNKSLSFFLYFYFCIVHSWKYDRIEYGNGIYPYKFKPFSKGLGSAFQQRFGGSKGICSGTWIYYKSQDSNVNWLRGVPYSHKL